MAALDSALLVAVTSGENFWRQAALNAVSPTVAALLGGLVVSVLIQQAQARRETRTLRQDLSTEMMTVAYAFYFRLTEVVRVEQHKAATPSSQRWVVPPNPERFTRQFEEFRISARVLEERLRISFRDDSARWLWHGVVDMLTARYYRLVHIRERYEGLIKMYSQHPKDPEIPKQIQSLFLTLEEFDDEETVDTKIMTQFEVMLNDSINEVLRRRIQALRAGAVLQPG
ncbi:hypothetical protein OG203_34280 [Nocardia sp. NBC_01499]|uniref:hypothetical protein n=1 Tax=Nocardia sp. NBC_01499 TaxID=2903597 RepID=UPI00386F2E2A